MEENKQETHNLILDNIKDTEMEVRVVLARKDMNIGDIYDIVPGKILNFEAPVSSPVHLAVSNKVFAKGIIIQSGDNYGCEVTEIL